MPFCLPFSPCAFWGVNLVFCSFASWPPIEGGFFCHHEGWESFSKHLSFVVGEGTRIWFWHDRWIGDNTLKFLYPDLYLCSDNKDACISEVLWLPEWGTVRGWDLRFYREFEDWELVTSYSLLEFIQSHIPWG